MDRKVLFEEFHNCWSEINAAYERYAKQLGLSYTFLEVLCELYYAKDKITQKIICDRCHLPKTTVNAIISGLVKEKYAVLEEIPNDRRQKSIYLTAIGRQYASPIMDHMHFCELQAFDVIDEHIVTIMLKGMKDYQRIFDEKLNGGKE